MTPLGRWADAYLGGLFRFCDKYKVTRRTALFGSLWLTADSYIWAKRFAEAAPSGVDWAQKPLIIGAVLGAVTAMQGWVLKLYIDGKEK